MPGSPPKWRSQTYDSRRVVVALLILCALCYWPLHSRAADRANVPFRNWGGLAINWHWTYDAIKKLVSSGPHRSRGAQH